MNVTITRPLSTATPESAMKPTAAEIENGMSRSQSATTPPVSASGTPVKTSSASVDRAEGSEEQHEDQQQRQRHDDAAAGVPPTSRCSNCPPQSIQ